MDFSNKKACYMIYAIKVCHFSGIISKTMLTTELKVEFTNRS